MDADSTRHREGDKLRDCVFCRIVSGEIPSQHVFDDGVVFGIRDIDPVAPTHLLVIPFEHVVSIRGAEEHQGLLGHMLSMAQSMALGENLDKGYRVIVNQGPDAGQVISHLHFHVLGGRQLGGLG